MDEEKTITIINKYQYLVDILYSIYKREVLSKQYIDQTIPQSTLRNLLKLMRSQTKKGETKKRINKVYMLGLSP